MLKTIAIFLSLLAVTSIAENDININQSHPNISVHENDKQLIFRPNGGLDGSFSLILEYEKSRSKHSSRSFSYIHYFDSAIKYNLKLSYLERLFWDEQKQVGMKSRLIIDNFFLDDSASIHIIKLNLLLGKVVNRWILFTGYRTPLLTYDRSDNYNISKYGRTYIGAEYRINKGLGLYSDYAGKKYSVGIVFGAMYLAYQPKIDEIDIHHAFYDF